MSEKYSLIFSCCDNLHVSQISDFEIYYRVMDNGHISTFCIKGLHGIPAAYHTKIFLLFPSTILILNTYFYKTFPCVHNYKGFLCVPAAWTTRLLGTVSSSTTTNVSLTTRGCVRHLRIRVSVNRTPLSST